MPAKNRDFLPPELCEAMRMSSSPTVKQLFTSAMSKGGALTAPGGQQPAPTSGPKAGGGGRVRWGAALIAENQRARVRHDIWSFWNHDSAGKQLNVIVLHQQT